MAACGSSVPCWSQARRPPGWAPVPRSRRAQGAPPEAGLGHMSPKNTPEPREPSGGVGGSRCSPRLHLSVMGALPNRGASRLAELPGPALLCHRGLGRGGRGAGAECGAGQTGAGTSPKAARAAPHRRRPCCCPWVGSVGGSSFARVAVNTPGEQDPFPKRQPGRSRVGNTGAFPGGGAAAGSQAGQRGRLGPHSHPHTPHPTVFVDSGCCVGPGDPAVSRTERTPGSPLG